MDNLPLFRWDRHGGYEVSSAADKRFSAFFAKLDDGRSIECHYQCDVKGYDPGGTQWQLGKGRPPKKHMTPKEMVFAYTELWRQWAKNHPELMEELYDLALKHDGLLSDRFAVTSVNQAHALSILLNEMSETRVHGDFQ